ncbi:MULTISPECIES: acetyl-CoA carboxylase biotin carboxylase subunit [Prauserella salsuginis group]|uniref:biotin carboxylase n=1 Tax=Prauserella salsuginis TaxID=387889 RepID=A0ABW6G0R4_9PSEU|nr:MULTISPECIES: acetyl-CoA carboxylase biotin carboxylase subunit [Prauserella salsuginis group]MCR3721932.1 acetyl-CoA/propionyl-CoA carboxylase, biotin carboxylase, biotin carboxyl carrier protein [Prauserella flava]MCR3735938.1 acetyl-CoA/propionyl-CoA carboxylase, biotin carboxylase, biotin carboxyl carrier protein [Prauserella salsuginis]
MFDAVLVANRGEIAVRVIATLKRLGIRSIAVYSEADQDAMHVKLADTAVCVGQPPAAGSYLNIDAILDAADRAGADAIHPGYGFLAENAKFAQAVADRGLAFVGPSPQVISEMGSKINARRIMADAGVPTVPGLLEPVDSADAALASADGIGYPVAVKASGAGGGKGFRIAHNPDELPAAFHGAQSEGERFFNDSTVYLERYLADPRHVEVQVLGDTLGNVVHLYDRDCTIQRRHQKLVEEAPTPTIDEDFRRRICAQAMDAARAIGYVGAGTVEGLVTGSRSGEPEFFFLEMNTRIQVEHGITEMITGVDIVEQQLRAAAGQPLSVEQDEVRIDGHAIEVRINAENAAKGFLPSAGTITRYKEPTGAGVRVDSGVREGTAILPHYDSLLAKVLVHGATREDATARMRRALDEFVLEGPKATLLPFHRALLATDEWANAGTAREITADPRTFMAQAGTTQSETPSPTGSASA